MIEIEDLSFSYDRSPIIEKSSLSISKGAFIGIFGPNGGGKTTFLHLLLGFLKPTAGTIKIDGMTPEKAASLFGYVPQTAPFDKKFPITALDVVLMGMVRKNPLFGSFEKACKESALAMLKKVQLEEKASAPFGTLSGGEAQRVLFARALISDPKILILDEPTASVDPQAEEILLGILEEEKGKRTILFVTHDLETILDKTEKLLCVQKKITLLDPKDVCKHFASGLYHKPLLETENG